MSDLNNHSNTNLNSGNTGNTIPNNQNIPNNQQYYPNGHMYNPMMFQNRQMYFNPNIEFASRHDIYQLQKYIDNNFNILHKYIDVTNKKIDTIDSKLNSIFEQLKGIRTKNIQNRRFNKNNNIPLYRNSKFRKKKRNNRQNINNFNDKDTFQNISPIFKQPPNGKNKSPSMIVHIADLNPMPKNTKIKKSEKNIDPIMNILGSLMFGGQFNVDPKKMENNENIDVDTDTEDELTDYNSGDEFEELDVKIENLDDIIKLGEMYDKLKNDKEINDSVECEYFDNDNPKEHKVRGILCRDGKVRLVNGNTNEDEISENKSIDNIKTKKKSKSIFEMDGKKYSINLETLNKLLVPLKKLQSLIGLESVKTSIVDMILYYVQGFENRNKNMLHTIIEGPPGVGKTELGKILAEIYAGMGIIPSNKFKLVRRTDLVGEYLGHTAHKTQQVIDEADGGVLFIDEAYSLGNEEKRDSYAKECIDTINQNLSEKRKNLIVIIAGYPEQLEKCFFSYNPGLKRRFPFRFKIDGYQPNELKDIFMKMINDSRWEINEDNIDQSHLLKFFTENREDFPHYGGDIENLIIDCKFMHSRRVVGKHPKLRRFLTKEDIHQGLERFKKNKKEESFISKHIRSTLYI